ncbi:MAG: carbonic anhydrase [Acidobacteriota bacterium]
MISPLAALDALHQGNRRFVSGNPRSNALPGAARLPEASATQRPFAILLGCSDSRVPVELVFDQGFGDLFVIRVAGNIAGPSQVGSVEFAALNFGTRLVVVLGHSRCGAIVTTLEGLLRPGKAQSPHLQSIIDQVLPSLEGLGTGEPSNQDDLIQQAVRANVRASVKQLREGSKMLGKLIENEGLLVLGAEYSLETGIVDFFEGLEEIELT